MLKLYFYYNFFLFKFKLYSIMREHSLDKFLEQELIECFQLFDSSKQNEIEGPELKAALRSFGIEKRKKDIELLLLRFNK